MEDATMNGEVLRTKESKKRVMSNDSRNYVHTFILDNAACLEEWRHWVFILS